MSKYIAVTGCAGFIGRVVVAKLCARGDRVYGVDRLDYAADPERLRFQQNLWPEHFHFRCEDVRNLGRLPDVDAVIHLAASTHVDNSLTEAQDFVANNIDGTAKMLELTRAKSQHGIPLYIQVSTDEVYGPIMEGTAGPDAPLHPTSPYAASKAAADLLVQAWGKTYGVPYSIVRPTNCYGLRQYPEKLIPKCVRSTMLGRPIPIHGDGTQTRQWLWVEDLVDAILMVLDRPDLGGIINVGGNTEARVIDVANVIRGGDGVAQTGFNRPAGDLRYAVDDTRIRAAGWAPKGDFWADLPGIIEAERKRFRW